jgi:hypothetical protein
MLVVETIGRIRREHLVKGKSIKEIVRAEGVAEYGAQDTAVGRDLAGVPAVTCLTLRAGCARDRG